MTSFRPPIRGQAPTLATMPPGPVDVLPAIPAFARRPEDASDALPTPGELVGRTIRQAVVTDAFLALEFDDGSSLYYER